MIRINHLPLPLGGDMEQLRKRAARALGVHPAEIQEISLAKQSIDARNKYDVHYVCAVDVTIPEEAAVVQRADSRNVSLYAPQPYEFPQVNRHSALPPVVVGMGPAGLFAALYLARHGLPCIVLERGQEIDRRTSDVERFWQTGQLDPASNVQFGEGGAGTFSDGKLNTGTHDPRISAVMETLMQAGAPQDIRWSNKPHVGTDVLRQVVKQMRQELMTLGCDIRFGHKLQGLMCAGGSVTGVEVEGPAGHYELSCDALILAPGHSARDTFRMLERAGVPMEAKSFAVGLRIEHLQKEISFHQYGPAWEKLPPADYKLACHLPNGRSAFTFCVCPGGSVVAATSEAGGVVTNGMSMHARDGQNINGGLLVGVGPEDFSGNGPLAGVRFQEQWEREAFQQGGGTFCAPVQRVADFLDKRPSQGPGTVVPTYRPGVVWTQLDGCLPAPVIDTLRQALPLMDRKLHGFSAPDAVLVGVETRSSSPVRVLRDEGLQSPLRGLYPCGEGAGYAGGIVSAAVDGIRVAEAVARG